jgi:hypothetical protein
MFDFLGRFHRNGSRFCEECGRRTNYRRCDQCAGMALTAHLDLAAETTPGTPPTSALLTPAERAYLAEVHEAAPVPDETPMDDEGYPALANGAPMVVAPLGDEFAEQVVWLRLAPETLPPIRSDWSTACPWCAREMRELCDDTYTHRPRRESVRTCERHHAALLELASWLRNEKFGKGGAA